MTGYGKAEATYNGKKIHIEVKSLNSKNLDLSTRIPSIYREKEMDIRKFAAAELERGKEELTIWCEKGIEQAGLTINPSASHRPFASHQSTQGLPSPRGRSPCSKVPQQHR